MKKTHTENASSGKGLLLGVLVLFFLLLCAACLPLIRWMFQPEFGP